MPRTAESTPLIQTLESILRHNLTGLTPPELRRELIRRSMPGVLEKDIVQALNHRLFIRLPGDRYVLRSNQPMQEMEDEVPSEDQAQEINLNRSTLAEFPSMQAYVIFDVETTGKDPATCELFQLSAIKIIGDSPVDIFDLYARIDTQKVAPALRKKLHFDSLGLDKILASAPEQDIVVQEFRNFCSDLPLVAHNGKFDFSVLQRYYPEISNPLIDTMELFVLAFPTAPRHSMEPLCQAVGLDENGQRWNEVIFLDQKLGISRKLGKTPGSLFHSAIFDCLMLYFLFQEARDKLSGLAPLVKSQFRALSSDLGDWIDAPQFDPVIVPEISDLIPLRYWGPELQEDTLLPETGLDFTEQTVINYYQNFIKEPLTHLRYVDAQKVMIGRVTQNFANGSTTMLEAPTGTGKTLAYLLPSILFSRARGLQVIISTSTKTLQDQIIRDLKERFRPFLPIAFRFSVLKGQDNYLCLKRFWDVYQEAFYGSESSEVPFEEKLTLLYFLRFVSETEDGDLQSLSYWWQKNYPVFNEIKYSVCSDSTVCNDNSTCYPYCFHPMARAFASIADLLIVNHTLLLTRHWRDDQQFNLIIDEAHNLEDVATNALTVQVSRNQLEQAFSRLLRPDGKRGLLVMARRFSGQSDTITQAIAVIRELRKLNRAFGDYLREFVEYAGVKFHPKYGATWRMRVAPGRSHHYAWRKVEPQLQEIIKELNILESLLIKIIKGLQETDTPRAGSLAREMDNVSGLLFGRPEQQAGLCDYLRDLPQVGYDPRVKVHWIELEVQNPDKGQEIKPDKILWSFRRAPVRVDDALQTMIYDRSQSILMTSATLTLGEGGFGYFTSRLGLTARISDEQLIQIPKTFDYKNRVLLVMPGYFRSSARNEEINQFTDELAHELSCLFRYTEGRGLVLHTARSRMEYVALRLEEQLKEPGISVYWQESGSSTRALKEEFEAEEESVLLGLRSFWEGVDVPGPSLSYLVIEKLPFPVPTDPIIEARKDELRSRGGNEWMDYLIPLASLQFKQGFGRLMRKPDDYGVVLFMDKRFRRDAIYREIVLSSLPGYKRNDDTIEAERTRLDTYRLIGEHMSEIFPWDWANRLILFPCIGEEVIPEIEKLLAALRIPLRIHKEEYEQYRANLLQAARLLVSGFSDFRPEQDEAMKSILAGQDTLVVLPTGSGKSLTFQLPALLREGVTIVFSPLIALMRDQVDKLHGLGLQIVDYIVSGQSGAHRDDVFHRIREGKVRLVYISPERIRDPALAEALRKAPVTQIVVDEAHCVHMWGNSFRPDFLKIPSLFSADRPPLVALTATATQDTRRSITKTLAFHEQYALIERSVNRPELTFLVFNNRSTPERITTQKDKLKILIKILRAAQRNDEFAIIYTSTIKDAEYLSRMLDFQGFTVRHYHGRMNAQEQEAVQEMFREGQVKIIIATKAFGMGIDKSDVRYVIHYNLPGDLESYFQEAGRAGRDGKQSYCILLYEKKDINTQRYFIEKAFPTDIQLNQLLGAIKRSPTKIFNSILVKPFDLAEESEIDIERIDIGLHLLEQMGFIRRTFNFTLMANLLLSHSLEWLTNKLSSDKADLLERLHELVGVSDNNRVTLDLIDAADKLKCSPLYLDQTLLELSAAGWAVYRPWDRGYVIEPLVRFNGNQTARLLESDVHAFQTGMEQNLHRVVYYAESLGKGDCRREYIVKYFGEPATRGEMHCCDLCHPSMDVPWQHISEDEALSLPEMVDPINFVLRAVEWNDSLRKWTFPYTTKVLAYILNGNTYPAAQYEKDPVQKAKRISRIESSPMFGILKGISGGEKTVLGLLQGLEEHGYICKEKISFTKEDSTQITYEAPILSERGTDQIASGKYLSTE